MAVILLVEDDLPLMRLYQGVLEAEYQVVTAESCAEAIKAIDAHHPNLVVLDLNLPDAPGITIINYLEARTDLAQPTIIVMTGFAYYKREALPPSVVEVLNKPVTTSRLLRVVQAALASRVQF